MTVSFKVNDISHIFKKNLIIEGNEVSNLPYPLYPIPYILYPISYSQLSVQKNTNRTKNTFTSQKYFDIIVLYENIKNPKGKEK